MSGSGELVEVAEWPPPSDLRFGPGVLIPYDGEPPRYTRDPDGTIWRCPGCAVEVPAGVMPFPHTRHCRLGPGAIVHVIYPDVGDEVLRALTWDWPAPYDGEQRQARRRLERKSRVLEEHITHIGERWVNYVQVIENPYPPGQWPPYHVFGPVT